MNSQNDLLLILGGVILIGVILLVIRFINGKNN